jgi:hypothetical protein
MDGEIEIEVPFEEASLRERQRETEQTYQEPIKQKPISDSLPKTEINEIMADLNQLPATVQERKATSQLEQKAKTITTTQEKPTELYCPNLLCVRHDTPLRTARAKYCEQCGTDVAKPVGKYELQQITQKKTNAQSFLEIDTESLGIVPGTNFGEYDRKTKAHILSKYLVGILNENMEGDFRFVITHDQNKIRRDIMEDKKLLFWNIRGRRSLNIAGIDMGQGTSGSSPDLVGIYEPCCSSLIERAISHFELQQKTRINILKNFALS